MPKNLLAHPQTCVSTLTKSAVVTALALTITACGGGGSGSSGVSGAIDDPIANAIPVATDAAITTDEDTVQNGQATATDEDADDLSYTLNSQPSQGTVSMETDGSFSYTPAPNINGNDSFEFKVTDPAGGEDIGTISVTITPVNDAPTANEGDFSVQESTELSGTVSGDDVDGDSLTYALDQDVSNGTLILNNDGSFTYTSDASFTGEDTFTFTATDGTLSSAPAKVSINVTALPVNGVSYDMIIPSDVDGEDISFTVHEPDILEDGVTYPLVLQGHGYGGSKISATNRSSGSLYGLLSRGYGMISIDQRGFGQSGGTIRLFDPEFEGKDLLQILDWAEANLPWLQYSNPGTPDANLVLGAIGASYGGGYQHTIYALDPKKRMDAIAPEITWHDLRYSLFSGNVFKSYWASILSGLGNGTGNQDPEVNEGLTQGLTTNSLDQDKLDLLYRHSIISHCEGNNSATHGDGSPLEPMDALYWQSARDTLFNMNGMVDNVNCLTALGGDVRMLTKINGHDAGDGEACGALDKVQSIRDWFDEKLKGEADKANYIPKFCFSLGESGTDAAVALAFPLSTGDYDIGSNSIIASSSSTQSTSVLLTTIAEDNTILAGIPTVSLNVADATPGEPEAGDPILFLGIGIRESGASSDTLVMANQVRPIRGYGDFNVELVGVNVRVQAGDEVRLLIYSGYSMRYPNSGSSSPAAVTVTGTASIPLLPASTPAPPSNTE